MFKGKKTIQGIFIWRFFHLFRTNAVTNILFWLDIVGWMISLFPKIMISAYWILILNLIVLISTAVYILVTKKHRIMTEPEAILLEHTYFVNALAITSDEKFLASCGGDHYAILWDIERRKIVSRIPHEYWVGNVAFSLDDQYLYTLTGKNGLLTTWEIEAGKSMNTVENNCLARGLAVCRSGCNLIMSCEDGTVRTFNPTHQNCNPEQTKISDVELRTIVTSKSGYSAAANIQGKVFLDKREKDDAIGFKTIYQDENKEMVRNLNFNTDGSLLAFTDSGGYLKILDIESGKIISIKAHNGHAIAVTFCMNDQFIATGGQDAIICVWKLHKDGLEKYFEIHGHHDDITSLVFDHRKRLYSASRDSSIKIWNLNGLY